MCLENKIDRKREPPLAKFYLCGKFLARKRKFVILTTNRMLGLVRRNIWYCTESIKETLYVDFVRPKLQCAAVARDPRIKCDIIIIKFDM